MPGNEQHENIKACLILENLCLLFSSLVYEYFQRSVPQMVKMLHNLDCHYVNCYMI